jgi:hypothetical protein
MIRESYVLDCHPSETAHQQPSAQKQDEGKRYLFDDEQVT